MSRLALSVAKPNTISVEGPDSPTPQNLLRISVGLESVDDLMDDLTQALQ